MRVLVCGGRDFEDERIVFDALDRIDAETRIEIVIEGGQRTRDRERGLIGGADLWACRWTYARRRAGMRFDADWSTHGRAAGPIRNQRMLDEGRPDMVIAFPGGRGTADMVRRARKAGVPVKEVG